jgi:hypothetical protein
MYRGIVKDRLNTIENRKTIYYTSYKNAHEHAKKLGNKHFTKDRFIIEIEQK